MPLPISVELPIKTVSESNMRDSWPARAKRAKSQRRTAQLLMWSKAGKPPALCEPLAIRVVRIGPRRLDTDNLGGALKAVIDGIADWLGVPDGDFRLMWEYGQEPSVGRGRLPYAVRVEIIPACPAPSEPSKP